MAMSLCRRTLCAIALPLIGFSVAPTLHAQTTDSSLYTGTVRLACEALLCLSSSAGSAQSACNPALSYYFGINERYLSDTLASRLNFLQQCPVANQSPEMSSLVNAISRGAGRCDAASFNATLQRYRIDSSGKYWLETSDKAPDYCRAYQQHAYTDLVDTTPRYVGTVEEGGYWVEPGNYDAELAKYQKALEERKKAEELEAAQWRGGW